MNEELPNPEDFDNYSYSVKDIDTVVSLIAIFHAITGVLTFPLAYFILSSGPLQAPVIVIFMLMLEGAVLVVTIPVYIIIGVAIWSLQTWAWKVAVIINVVCLFFNIMGGVVLTAILNILLLLALNNSNVRLALAPMD